MSEPQAQTSWKDHLLRILALLLVVGLSVFLFANRHRAEELAGYGYPGIFLLSMISNATLVLPMPGVAITFAAGAVFNPLGVALAAGLGSTIGELTGYVAGFSGQTVLDENPTYNRLKAWTERHGKWAILALAIVPNPVFDLAGAAAGALRMPLPTFFLWALLGKTLKMMMFAYAGAQSADWVLDFLAG